MSRPGADLSDFIGTLQENGLLLSFSSFIVGSGGIRRERDPCFGTDSVMAAGSQITGHQGRAKLPSRAETLLDRRIYQVSLSESSRVQLSSSAGGEEQRAWSQYGS